MTLNISIARISRFLWCNYAEFSFSNNLMYDDYLSLHIILKHLSWNRFIFVLFVRLWHIHIKGQQLKYYLKNEFISMCLLFIFIKGAILANALIFLSAFLDISQTWQSNVSLLSIMTSNNFSQPLFSIENSPIFIFVFSLVLTK